jgi:hypothetical protein
MPAKTHVLCIDVQMYRCIERGFSRAYILDCEGARLTVRTAIRPRQTLTLVMAILLGWPLMPWGPLLLLLTKVLIVYICTIRETVRTAIRPRQTLTLQVLSLIVHMYTISTFVSNRSSVYARENPRSMHRCTNVDHPTMY